MHTHTHAHHTHHTHWSQVDRLEELLRDKQQDTASLRCQLDEVQGEHAATSAELGARRDQLRPHEQTLRVGAVGAL